MSKNKINESIYYMNLTKKEDILAFDEHISQAPHEYTVFGSFDVLRFKLVKEMADLLDVPHNMDLPSTSGANEQSRLKNALVQGFSLFSCGTGCSCGGYDMPHFCTHQLCADNHCKAQVSDKAFQDDFLGKNITTVTLVKLDTLALHGDSNYKDLTGLEMLCKVRGKIEEKITNYLKSLVGRKGERWQVKTFLSLGMYDLVIFLSTAHPKLASSARLEFVGKIPEILFTTSFGIFDYKSNQTEERWTKIENNYKNEDGTSAKVGFRFRGVIRRGFEISTFVRQLSHLLEASPNEPVVVGNVPGDEDFVVNFKEVSLINVLKLYRKNDKSYLLSTLIDCYGDKVDFKDVFRRSNSTFAFFEHHEGYQNARLDCDVKTNKLQKLYIETTSLYDSLKERAYFPKFSKHHIEYILYTCSRLIGLRSHQNTAYRFLTNLKFGLDRHELQEDLSDLKTNLVGFSTSLALSLKDVVDASGLLMERLSELYTSTTYYKPIASLLQMSQDIFDVLGKKDRRLQLFLNISRDAEIQVVLYFYGHKGKAPRGNPFLASIDVPSPLMFDLKESYYYVLHEISHLLHTDSLAVGKRAFLDMILVYVTNCILSDIKGRNTKRRFTKKDTPPDTPPFIEIMNRLNELEAIKSLVGTLKDDEERFPTFVEKVGDALNQVSNELEVPDSDIELEILLTLKRFRDTNISRTLSSFSFIFREVRADILMCEMAGSNFSLADYCAFWERHFASFGTKPLEDDFAFIYRVCLVAEHFVTNRNEELRNGSVKIGDLDLTDHYNGWRSVWVPFVDYAMEWKTSEGLKVIRENGSTLFDKLSQAWNLPDKKSPSKHEPHEQIAFHINNWYRWVMRVEEEIAMS